MMKSSCFLYVYRVESKQEICPIPGDVRDFAQPIWQSSEHAGCHANRQEKMTVGQTGDFIYATHISFSQISLLIDLISL